jgi:protein TilB
VNEYNRFEFELMAELSRQLLRKRAEHNEGMLSNLEEVSLHQQELKKIENLDVYCRHLKILYLQNNLIEKMEGLNKLVELEYLNMAVNSVSKIEGLKRCESLNKLDLTLNFVDLEDLKESLENLEWCPFMTDLYMTGNPCTDWPNYRAYTIAKVETLLRLDGTEIMKSERLAAKTILPKLEKELEILAEKSIAKKE